MPTTPTSRQRLLDAAVRTIESHGEGAVRIREVAAEACVAYTSVYHFFGDREGLVQAAQVERYRRDLFIDFESLRTQVAGCASMDQLRVILSGMLTEFLSADRATIRLARVNALGSALDRPELERRFAELHEEFNVELAAALLSAQQRGWIRPGLDLRMVSAWYRGLISSRVHIELDGPRPEHVFWNKYTTEAVLAVVMGIAPDPQG